jgi:hypothetical protein
MGIRRNFSNVVSNAGRAEQRIFEKRGEQGGMYGMVQGSQAGMYHMPSKEVVRWEKL